MRRAFPLIAVSLTLVIAAMGGCARDRPESGTVVQIAAEDPEMKAAIEKARATLPQFWKAFEAPAPNEESFSLKVRFSDVFNSEHIWVGDIERRDGKIRGTIDNVPESVNFLREGQRVEVPPEDITDWMYMRDGKMVGNYTLWVLLKRMPREEAEQIRKTLVDP